MKQQYVIGIDGGGTNTTCLLANLRGQIIARVEAPASNHRKSDLVAARDAISFGIAALAEKTNRQLFDSNELLAVCAGLAGVDTELDAIAVRTAIKEVVPTDSLHIVNDGEIALQGALENESGILVISGTGSIVWAQTREGHRLRVGGWDYILSDEGSGYSLGIKILKAIAAAHDQRTPPTSLFQLVLRHFAAKDFDELLEHIYHDDLRAQDIAALAPLADVAAEANDSVAIKIVDDAVTELMDLVKAAARLARLESAPFALVTGGGVLNAQGYFAAVFRQAIKANLTHARFIQSRHTPAEGAVLMALQMTHLDCVPRAISA